MCDFFGQQCCVKGISFIFYLEIDVNLDCAWWIDEENNKTFVLLS